MELKIDDELVDKIVLQVLVDHYKMNEDFIEKLEAQDELKPHEQEDLEYDREMQVHLDALIRYFTTESDYERLMK